ALPPAGRVRRPTRDQGGDRRRAQCLRAHGAAPTRRPRGETRRPRRGGPRTPAPGRRQGDRARPRPSPLTRERFLCRNRAHAHTEQLAGGDSGEGGSEGDNGGSVGGAGVVFAPGGGTEDRWAIRKSTERNPQMFGKRTYILSTLVALLGLAL